MQNFVFDRSHKYQYNYRAESLEPLRQVSSCSALPRTLEIPNNPNLSMTKPWNNSTEVLPRVLAQRRKDITQKAIEHSHIRNKKLQGYISPRSRTTAFTDKLRTLKTVKSLSQNLSDSVSLQSPLTPQLVDATEPCWNTLRRSPPKRLCCTKHSGVWEYNALEVSLLRCLVVDAWSTHGLM
jgi:hypothetical protein